MARGISGKALAGEQPSVAQGESGFGYPVFALSRRFDTDDEVLVAKAPFRFRILAAVVHCYETNGSGSVNVEIDDADVFHTDITCDTIEEVTGVGDLSGAGGVFLMNMSGANGTSSGVVGKGAKIDIAPTNSASGMITLLCVRSIE